MAGLVYIIIICLISILGYIITPDKAPNANEQYIELSAAKPGTTVLMLKIRANTFIKSRGWFKTMLSGRYPVYRFIPIDHYTFQDDRIVVMLYKGNDSTSVLSEEYYLPDVLYPVNTLKSFTLTGDSVLWTNLTGQIKTAPVEELKKLIRTESIIKKHFLLGTDRFGRDLLSRLIIGSRVSLAVGFISVTISLFLGILLGGMAGYFKGWIDKTVLWLINVVWSVPTLLLVIAITFVLGKGFWQVFIAVGLTMWVEVARIVRGQVLSMREKEYVEAARALGFSNFRILFRHILPNVTGPVIIIAAANFSSAILMEAGLSFLGLGVQPPVPSWGSMIKDHYGYILVNQAYLAIIPGIAILLLILAFTLVGNGLRDAFDTRLGEPV